MHLHPREQLFLEKHANLNKTYIGHPPFFRFKDGRKYTADFYCKEDDTFIEVVGCRQAYHANKDKYILMGVEFPSVKFELFFFPNSFSLRAKKTTSPMKNYLLVMTDKEKTIAYLLRALKEEKDLWQVAANKEGRTLVSWIKFHLNKVVAKVNK